MQLKNNHHSLKARGSGRGIHTESWWIQWHIFTFVDLINIYSFGLVDGLPRPGELGSLSSALIGSSASSSHRSLLKPCCWISFDMGRQLEGGRRLGTGVHGARLPIRQDEGGTAVTTLCTSLGTLYHLKHTAAVPSQTHHCTISTTPTTSRVHCHRCKQTLHQTRHNFSSKGTLCPCLGTVPMWAHSSRPHLEFKKPYQVHCTNKSKICII